MTAAGAPIEATTEHREAAKTVMVAQGFRDIDSGECEYEINVLARAFAEREAAVIAAAHEWVRTVASREEADECREFIAAAIRARQP